MNEISRQAASGRPAVQPELRLSVLDLTPIPAGSSAGDALRNSLDLVRRAEELGYTRYWFAEHHNTGSLASPVPALMVGQAAGVTSRIRVGSGGVMLPNHAPLQVAESFRVLEALYPGRIDLGLGRAPGTDVLAALALRGTRGPIVADDFPEQLIELFGYLTEDLPADHRFRRVLASPQGVPVPDLWLLGSSDVSAILAAREGVGFAFAHHINPEPAVDALRRYREQFVPSRYQVEPAALLAVAVLCAESDTRAEALAAVHDLFLLRAVQGHRGPIPSEEEALGYRYSPAEQQFRLANRERLIAGTPGQVRSRLTELATQAGVSELMITTITHDHAERSLSYTLLAEAFGLLSVNTRFDNDIAGLHRKSNQ